MFQLKSGFLVWVLFTACLCLPIGCDRPGTEGGKQEVGQAKSADPATTPPQHAATEQPTAEIEVEVEIDFKNSTPAINGKVTLEEDQTAFGALERFASQRDLKVNFKGQRETLFVMGIGEVANQGADGINWTYRVNGELGDRSSGIFSLKPGDKVSWIFGKYP
jgi:hypothetical protein